MPIRTPKARKLSTASEFSLFAKSLSRSVKDLSEAQVRVAVGRARKLRDKYRQTADRQEREVRGKADARGRRPAAGNLGTREKMQLFQETLDRYEVRLAEFGGRPKSAAKKAVRAPGKKTKVRAKKKVAAKKKATPKRKVAAKKKATPKKKVAAKRKATPKRKATAKKKVAKKKTTRKTPALGAWTKQKTVAAKKSNAKQKTRPTSKVQKTGAKAQGSTKYVQRQQTTKMSRQKHTAARGRRSQAKRDSHGR